MRASLLTLTVIVLLSSPLVAQDIAPLSQPSEPDQGGEEIRAENCLVAYGRRVDCNVPSASSVKSF